MRNLDENFILCEDGDPELEDLIEEVEVILNDPSLDVTHF